MRKKLGYLLFFVLITIAVFGYFTGSKEENIPNSGMEPISGTVGIKLSALKYQPVIDPGHGGEDPGAISITGVNESEINLDIALRMSALMRFLGVTPVMTRETDISIHDPSADTIAEKKKSDLRNRAKLVNEIPDAVLLSIHQNDFGQSDVKGAEAYYNGNELSKSLAEATYSMIASCVDIGGDRLVRKKESNYLMDQITCPAVLVECGFISNPDEEARLRSGGYQTRMAAAIVVSYLNWTHELS